MRKNRWIAGVGIAAMAAAIALSGCGKKAPKETETAAEVVTEAAETKAEETVPEKEETNGIPNADNVLDFTGDYKSEEADAEIELTQTSKNQYDVHFAVIRLCDMEGNGNWVDGAIEVELEDPNGKPMYGVFFYDEDSCTYTLRITQSDWNLIAPQTDFTGFTMRGNIEDALIGYKDGVLNPMESMIDLENIQDADLPVAFFAGSFEEKDGRLMLKTDVYAEDLFDTVDVSMLKEGDTIMLGGEPYVVDTKTEAENGYDINGGLEKGGFMLLSNGGGTYRYCGYDDITSYSSVGTAVFPVSEKCVFTDSMEIEKGEQKIPYAELKDYMKEAADTERDFFNPYNTKVVLENGEITEIVRMYRP